MWEQSLFAMPAVETISCDILKTLVNADHVLSVSHVAHTLSYKMFAGPGRTWRFDISEYPRIAV
jgi:hypothetical protein